MNLKQTLALASDELMAASKSVHHLSDSPALDAELLLLHVLNASRTILFTHPEKTLSAQENQAFQRLLARRKCGEPIAYILGYQGFWSLDLEVAPHTLIPRGDTESLIEWILEQPDLQPNAILDLGTGTGALALALAKEFPAAQVTGLDIIPEAVALATRNADRNNITNAQFYQSHWFDGLSHRANASTVQPRFDLIVSNPPYIDETDVHLDQGDVQFEPKSALVADEQGFHDLYHIAEHARPYLNGWLVMEHGWTQAENVRKTLHALGYLQVGSGRDLAGHERFTFGVYG